MTRRLFLFLAVTAVLPLLVAGCGGSPQAAPQPPDAYLANALDWIGSHSILASQVDFDAIRRDALSLTPAAKLTSDTYPAIRRALAATRDGLAWLYSPKEQALDAGMFVALPQLEVNWVAPGGPAARAGVQVGDRLLAVNGAPPQPLDGNVGQFDVDFGAARQVRLTMERKGQPVDLTIERDQHGEFSGGVDPTGRGLVAGAGRAGYLDLRADFGSRPYPGRVGRLMQALDGETTCGWIIDLRHNWGGDIWSYLAALGPLLGQGDLGGFVYSDGHRDVWSYRDGKVFWNSEARDESFVQGGIYTLRKPAAPVALLTSYTTIAAGELVAVAFEGRPTVRVIGEPTRGLARLVDHTPLSDGAEVYVSGAYATDRAGKKYEAPIQPDEFVTTDWTKIGTDQDPVIRAALAYLASRPECRGG